MGVPVKTLRFYSDEGLLPPAERSRSGYRLYGDEALLRLDLIRTLREAGLGLDSIKKVADPTFVESLRNNAKEVWGKFDMTAMRRASDEVSAAAKEAITRSVKPDSEEGKLIVEAYGTALAAARGATFDDRVRRGMRERFWGHDPRSSRYWELVATLNGNPRVASTVAEWKWISAAVIHHFA